MLLFWVEWTEHYCFLLQCEFICVFLCARIYVVIHLNVAKNTLEVFTILSQVLKAPDRELNSWVSIKKMSQYR